MLPTQGEGDVWKGFFSVTDLSSTKDQNDLDVSVLKYLLHRPTPGGLDLTRVPGDRDVGT